MTNLTNKAQLALDIAGTSAISLPQIALFSVGTVLTGSASLLLAAYAGGKSNDVVQIRPTERVKAFLGAALCGGLAVQSADLLTETFVDTFEKYQLSVRKYKARKSAIAYKAEKAAANEEKEAID